MATREELLDRQEFDTGAPEDTVYIVATGGNGSQSKTKPKFYHDDEDCFQLPENVEESTREAEQRRWRGPCSNCVLGGKP